MGFFGIGNRAEQAPNRVSSERLHIKIHEDFNPIGEGWHANKLYEKAFSSGELPSNCLNIKFEDKNVEALFEHFPFATKIKEESVDNYIGTVYFVDEEPHTTLESLKMILEGRAEILQEEAEEVKQ